MRLFLIIMISLFLIETPALFADQSLFYKEFNLIGGYSRQDEWIGESDALKNSIGFEDYRKFSGDYGDFLTTDLQLRIAYDSSESTDDAWAVEVHNAWAEFNPPSRNSPPVRVGMDSERNSASARFSLCRAEAKRKIPRV